MTPEPFAAPRCDLRIGVLAARDWQHPQGGGSGEILRHQLTRWARWGASVELVAGGFPGAAPRAELEGVAVERIGTDSTVHVLAGLRLARRFAPDVVLEVVSGLFFFTPLWSRAARVVWVHHVHREQYAQQFGALGRPAALALETLPLRSVYRRSRFVVPSHATAAALRATGVAPGRITVSTLGMSTEAFAPGDRAVRPTLLWLGRLRRYKRVDVLLEMMTRLPEDVVLEIAGDGDQRSALQERARSLGLDGRVRFHGFVDDDARRRLLQRAWVHVTASSAEGWGLTCMEAAACATPTAALASGGLGESVRHGVSGLLAPDATVLAAHVRTLLADAILRARLSEGALGWARGHSWDVTAATTLAALVAARADRQALSQTPTRTASAV